MFWRYFNSYTNKWMMRVLLLEVSTGIIFQTKNWKMGDFPFEYYQTDVAPLILESKGIIHNIREPNRALNEIVSQIHESARIMGDLNWRIPRGSNVDVITDNGSVY